MKYLIIYLVVLSLHYIVLAVDPVMAHAIASVMNRRQKDPTEQSLDNAQSMVNLIKSLRTTSKTAYSPQQNQQGFISLNQNGYYESGTILIKNIDKLFEIWMKELNTDNIPESYKRRVGLMMQKYALQTPEEKYTSQSYDLRFNNNLGSLLRLSINFTPHKSRTDAVVWDKLWLISSFKPAPSFFFVTKSRCNLFRCNSDTHVEYLPAVMTQEHFDTILSSSMGFLGGMMESQQLIDSA